MAATIRIRKRKHNLNRNFRTVGLGRYLYIGVVGHVVYRVGWGSYEGASRIQGLKSEKESKESLLSGEFGRSWGGGKLECPRSDVAIKKASSRASSRTDHSREM